jgi:hypothetical protein
MAPPPPADIFCRVLVSGQASPGADYDPLVRAMYVPRGVLEARMISRDSVTDG